MDSIVEPEQIKAVFTAIARDKDFSLRLKIIRAFSHFPCHFDFSSCVKPKILRQVRKRVLIEQN